LTEGSCYWLFANAKNYLNDEINYKSFKIRLKKNFTVLTIFKGLNEEAIAWTAGVKLVVKKPYLM
jgi:hypothetical protein